MVLICFLLVILGSNILFEVKEAVAEELYITQDDKVMEENQKKINLEKKVLDRQKEELKNLKYEVKVMTEELQVKEAELKSNNSSLNEKQQLLKVKEVEVREKEARLKEKTAEVAKMIMANKVKPVINTGEKVVYLTFDDGPSLVTERILNILAANKVKATFFVNVHIGYESTYLRIVNEGHKIGNHTYTHDYSEVYSSTDNFFNNIEQLNEYLNSIEINKPDIIRFPGGANNTVSFKYGGKDIMDWLVNETIIYGYDYFDWNVTSGDAEKTTQDKGKLVNNVIKRSAGKTRPVVLMHDSASKSTTADALQEIINYFKSEGYSFGVLENGLGIPAKLK